MIDAVVKYVEESPSKIKRKMDIEITDDILDNLDLMA